jgi:hypothetical protein
MRHLLFALSTTLLATVAACGSDGGGNPGKPDAAVATGDKYELHWGPVEVAPGTEDTQCVVVKLSNATDIKVHQMHNILGPGSHHVIVYRDDMDTVEKPTPYPCQPFTGALNPSGMVFPMMITQRQDDLLTLPDGVAYTLKANQMIRIEMHYINSSDAAIMAQATTEFYAADVASIHDEANILFIGTPDINLPAGSTQTVHEFFSPSRASLDLSAAKFFAITGHTHQLGTDMQVSTAETNGGAGAVSVYAPTPFVWSEPETTTHKPEFMVPTGGGFDFKCTYHNTTSTNVKFGESANDEMCFFWAYYYPSKGSHVCVHTTQFGGVDVCCPEAGPTVCGMLQ